MNRSELPELQFITPMVNVPSILEKGILCHRLAKSVAHTSIAMAEIQDIRAAKSVPGGRALHAYANLYICARNVMMYKRLDQRAELCVLSVSPEVLDLPGVVVASGNASSTYTKFRPAPEGLEIVDREMTFARYWTHEDEHEYYRRKSAKCAEVLVPFKVKPEYIMGARVCDAAAKARFDALGTKLTAVIDGYLFFVG